MDEEVNVAPKRKKKAKSKLDQEENLDIAGWQNWDSSTGYRNK